MDLLPLCGPRDDGQGLIPPGPSYMTPDLSRCGSGHAMAVEVALAGLSGAAATGFAVQLQLDDLAEVLDATGEDGRSKLAEARAACRAARRSLRVALLAMADLRDRLVATRGGHKPPPRPPRRRR